MLVVPSQIQPRSVITKTNADPEQKSLHEQVAALTNIAHEKKTAAWKWKRADQWRKLAGVQVAGVSTDAEEERDALLELANRDVQKSYCFVEKSAANSFECRRRWANHRGWNNHMADCTCPSFSSYSSSSINPAFEYSSICPSCTPSPTIALLSRAAVSCWRSEASHTGGIIKGQNGKKRQKYECSTSGECEYCSISDSSQHSHTCGHQWIIKLIIELQPRVLWCQLHLWTPLC